MAIRFIVAAVMLLSPSIALCEDMATNNCKQDAKENWNLRCKITRNTLATADFNDFWADLFTNIETVTVCASFNNRGGLNESGVTVTYTNKEGGEFSPFAMFNTVRFQSNMVSGKFSWIGGSPRQDKGFPPAAYMNGKLSKRYEGSSAYTETLSDGRKIVGEIHTTCSPIDVAESQSESPSCSGILHQSNGELHFGGSVGEDEGICVIAKSEESKVLGICTIGQFCKVSGTVSDCKDSGECGEMTDVTSVAKRR